MNYRSRLDIDLNFLGQNISDLEKLAPLNNILFMVKANAYGHGVVPIVKYCLKNSKIREFGVASSYEATELRRELPKGKFEIYVFSDLKLSVNKDFYKFNRIIPVISSMDDLDYFLSDKDYKRFPLCLKFNTGMNRLGLNEEDLNQIISKITKSGRSSIYHLMTHLSCASLVATNNKNIEQKKTFDRIKEAFKSKNISLERTSISNSGAIEQGLGLDETHIRPGLMLYGPTSLIKNYRNFSKWTGKNLSTLETYIIQTFEVEKGTPLGYGASPCPEDGVIAIIAIGYGDGFSTRFEGAHLYHKGIKGKIVGRVNMDMAQVLFPPDMNINAGELLKIWGNNPDDILQFSDETKIIPYEIFCQLTARVPRSYKNKESFDFKEDNHGKKLAY